MKCAKCGQVIEGYCVDVEGKVYHIYCLNDEQRLIAVGEILCYMFDEDMRNDEDIKRRFEEIVQGASD